MSLKDLLNEVQPLDPGRTLELFHKVDEVCVEFSNLEILGAFAALLRSMVYEAAQREPSRYPAYRRAVISACYVMADYVADMPERFEDLAGWLADKMAQVPFEASRGN